MDEKIAELQKLINKHDNIVFLAEQGFPQKAGFLISVLRTVCIIRNMIFHRKPY